MVTDKQVRKLWEFLSGGETVSRSAWKTGMDEKTARKYRDLGQLPSQATVEHRWRTRKDPFEEVWCEVHEQLEQNPGLQAKALFGWLQRKYPKRFQDGQLRSFQRGVKSWRATEGPPKEVFFRQQHTPGRLGASDFTWMNSLGVTIGGGRFDHLVYHFVLTYWNWESATICFSESFESLSEGLQNALWQLGGVPERHRTDRLSSAVNNLTDERLFTERYQSLMQHYGLEMEKTQAGKGNENGDVESSHRHFKEAVDQALMLRGSRDFESREVYAQFLQEVLQQRNAGRAKRLAEEQAVLAALPRARRESHRRMRVKVSTGSLIQIRENTYSVNSRLIGEQVEVRIYADHLEVWYGQRQVERLPRLRGRKKHAINYRHVIDWLVRKAGAFENYRYRNELFPTSRFRMAYDGLCEHDRSRASKEYLQILHLAARESETEVDDALRGLLDTEQPITLATVTARMASQQPPPSATDVTVDEPDLSQFDELLTDKEIEDGYQGECENDVDHLLEGTAPAHVP